MRLMSLLQMKVSMPMLVSVVLIARTVIPVCADEKNVFLREDFDTLVEWRPRTFPKIKEHTVYSIEKDAQGSYLKAKSNASASGIIYKKEFNVYEYPKVRWRWKVSNIYAKGNAEEKKGDDYPIRVYIVFKYDPGKAAFATKIKYSLLKKLYGEYPPDSSLNYIWANRTHEERILTNTYADQSRMVILQAGTEKTDTWQEEEVHILEDYRRAFEADPPPIARIAIMNDSDNTGERSVSYIDYIDISQ